MTSSGKTHIRYATTTAAFHLGSKIIIFLMFSEKFFSNIFLAKVVDFIFEFFSKSFFFDRSYFHHNQNGFNKSSTQIFLKKLTYFYAFIQKKSQSNFHSSKKATNHPKNYFPMLAFFSMLYPHINSVLVCRENIMLALNAQ